jgi:hypothetical protein
MSETPPDIERIVREVIAELRSQGATAGLSSSAPGVRSATAGVSGSAQGATTCSSTSRGRAAGRSDSPPAASQHDSRNGDLVLSARLVTMADIGDQLPCIRRLVVTPQAVVTPAVLDALRQRNISLSRSKPAAKTAATPLRLVVVAARTKTDPNVLASTLQGEGFAVQCHRTNCILEATDRLAGELGKSDTLGLLLTPHTAAALCLANRLKGLRAVLGANAGNLTADLAAVGANLLIIDPQVVGVFKLCQMAGELCRGGVRPCPDVFRKRLT